MLTAELPAGLIQVPGTDYVVLRDDSALSKWAMENASIAGEKYIADLASVCELKPGQVCLDVGAFIGDTAVLFLERGCEVIAIEAYDLAYQALCINCPTARCIHAAVGDGTPMRPTGKNVEGGSNAGCNMVEVGGETPSMRIDDLNLERLDYLKLDIEGNEPRAIAGAIETIRRCRPRILVECYDSALAMQGFRRNDVLHPLWREGYAISVAIGRAEDDRVDFFAVPTQKPLL